MELGGSFTQTGTLEKGAGFLMRKKLTARGTEILLPNGCLAPKYALGCQPKSVWKLRAGLPAFLLHWVKLILEVLSRNVLGKGVVKDPGEGSSSRDMGAQRKWPPLSGPSVSHRVLLAIRRAAAACQVVFAGGSSFTYGLKS